MNYEAQAADIVNRHYKSLVDDLVNTLTSRLQTGELTKAKASTATKLLERFTNLQSANAYDYEEMDLIERQHLKWR